MEQSEGSESEALRARFKRYENSRSVCIFHLSIPELLATLRRFTLSNVLERDRRYPFSSATAVQSSIASNVRTHH